MGGTRIIYSFVSKKGCFFVIKVFLQETADLIPKPVCQLSHVRPYISHKWTLPSTHAFSGTLTSLLANERSHLPIVNRLFLLTLRYFKVFRPLPASNW
jgi:hypothetical protein